MKDITGQLFHNKLTALRFIKYISGKQIWLFKCKCGNEKEIVLDNIKTNNTQSCGCIAKQGNNKRHGLKYHPLYNVWMTIKARCHNKNHKQYGNYGERGIVVYDLWFNNFLIFYHWSISNGYKKGLTIERLDNNFGYFPSNCIWTTRKRQANNRRSNKFITFGGKTQTVAQWTDELKYPLHLIYKRLKRGWSIEKTLTTPVR